MSPKNILLIRVNCLAEVFHTNHQVDILRATYPTAQLTTLATPQTETLELLQGDARFKQVLLFPPDDGTPEKKSLAAFRRFISQHSFDLTVVCFGSTPYLDYAKHIASGLLCPGKKMLMDREGRLLNLAGGESVRQFASALSSTVDSAVGRALASVLRRFVRRPIRRALAQSAGDSTADADQSKLTEPINRVLWMPVDGLGDLVMGLPALDALARAYPEATVDVLARSAYAPLFATLPQVHKVILFEPPGLPERTRRAATGLDLLKLVRSLRRENYDLAVDVSGKNIYRQLAFLSGARLRVGPDRSHFDKPSDANWSFLLTHPIPMGEEKRHTVENGRHLMQQIGLNVPVPAFFSNTPESATVQNTLCGLGVDAPFAIVHAASAVETKQWRQEAFAKVIDHLTGTYGLRVLVTGAPQDKDYNANILGAVQRPEWVRDGAGWFSLKELPSLYRMASLMVTIDSGPMHVAAAVKTPIVSLFLPGAVHLYHPFGQEENVLLPNPSRMRAVLDAKTGVKIRLMDLISVEDVTAAIDRRLTPMSP